VSLSAREQHTLSCIANELADSAPELTSFISVFNRLTSSEEMPELWQADKIARCGRQRPRRSSRRTWTRRQASHPGRYVPVITVLALIGVAMIIVALMLSINGREVSGNGRCAQSWPVCTSH
jgi:hypothetical protein